MRAKTADETTPPRAVAGRLRRVASVRQPKNKSANRTLSVLATFGRTGEPQSLTQISSALDIDKSVVHRILEALTYQGFLERDPLSKKYVVGLRAWEIGQRYRGARLEQTVTPLLQAIVDQHEGTGYLSQLDGLEIVYLALVNGPGPLRVHVDVGSRLPAYATAVGKSMLAQLPPGELTRRLRGVKLRALTPHTITSVNDLLRELEVTRQRGYAANREEAVVGVGSVGAAIVDAHDAPVAAVSVAFPMLSSYAHLWKALPSQVCAVAHEASRRLRTGGPIGVEMTRDS
jgi:DNA-binding IclR family transcriptional regulator